MNWEIRNTVQYQLGAFFLSSIMKTKKICLASVCFESDLWILSSRLIDLVSAPALLFIVYCFCSLCAFVHHPVGCLGGVHSLDAFFVALHCLILFPMLLRIGWVCNSNAFRLLFIFVGLVTRACVNTWLRWGRRGEGGSLDYKFYTWEIPSYDVFYPGGASTCLLH